MQYLPFHSSGESARKFVAMRGKLQLVDRAFHDTIDEILWHPSKASKEFEMILHREEIPERVVLGHHSKVSGPELEVIKDGMVRDEGISRSGDDVASEHRERSGFPST
jgi:hypothetical protein